MTQCYALYVLLGYIRGMNDEQSLNYLYSVSPCQKICTCHFSVPGRLCRRQEAPAKLLCEILWEYLQWSERTLGNSVFAVSTAGGCFSNISRALQDILLKFVYCRNRSSYENFKLELCMSAQSMALGTRTKFELEILTINVISGIVYFREIILESSRNVSETPPWSLSENICHQVLTQLAALIPLDPYHRRLWHDV